MPGILLRTSIGMTSRAIPLLHDITLFDGSILRLETIGSDHDPSDAMAALNALHKAEVEDKHVTGLLYFDPTKVEAGRECGLHTLSN